MQLTEHMRKHLIDGVIAAQQEGNPLLEGIDLQRLRTTLERDLTEEELASIMMLVGNNRNESIRAMCLTMIDRTKPTPAEPVAIQRSSRSWQVEQPLHRNVLRRLTHRANTAMTSTSAQSETA